MILILFSDIFISVKTYKIKKLTYDKKYNTIGKNVINKGECLMNEYQIQQERSKRLKQVIYRKFAKKYGQIQKTDLLDHEKDTAIKDILYTSINAEKVIDWDTEDGLKISDEDRSTFGIEEHEPEVDPKVVDTLVWIFATKAKMPNNMGTGLLEKITLRDGQKLENIDTTNFENELRQYFTEHYSELISDGYNQFLSDATKVANSEIGLHNENGELAEIAIKNNIDPKKFHCFGYQLTVQDGLVAEEESILGRCNIFYATPEAVNNRIYDLYSRNLFEEQKAGEKDRYKGNDRRKLKNSYITYAEKNGIEIVDKDVLEELPIDIGKVQGIATYLNRALNESGKIATDMTEEFANEIQKEYSKIMNLAYFDFSELESVKKALKGSSSLFYLNINDDNIVNRDEIRPSIVYATPEYLENTYATVMEKIKQLSHVDAFIKGAFDVDKTNKKKEAIRRYIAENGIEGIDISIPEVEIDHEKTEIIAEALLNMYGKGYEDKEGMKARILQKVEEKYPEIFYERQVIDLKDLIGEELDDMGQQYNTDDLYVQKDFIYVGKMAGSGKCIYATPESILDKIKTLDNKIANSKFTYDEERIRAELEEYAKNNNLEIEIPSVESVLSRRQRENDMFSFGGQSFSANIELDDPTARPKIEFNDTTLETMIKMSEGTPGAIVAIGNIVKSDELGPMLLLGLDDMNIRGSQIWVAYKDLYKENTDRFVKAIRNRDKNMVDFINQEIATIGGEKAVTGGASFDRSKNPDKYRFTALEVEELRTQRAERIEKQIEAREKMIANSPPKKKSIGQKNREIRETKKLAYRQRLINMGKKSIAQLDKELVELQEKEKQAKELCNEYEEQLPNQTHEEI